MMKLYSISFIIALALACNLNPNTRPLVTGDPQIIDETKNGQKLLIGDLDDPEGNYIYVANLKGTPYEMGLAFGQLFKKQLKVQVKLLFDYYLDQLKELLIKKHLPTFLAQKLTATAHGLGNQLLDLNVMITRKYTNPRYYEQIRGIAAGSKVSAKDIQRVNIIPEIIKAACTVAGIWTTASKDRNTLHMRALDWDAKNPISQYPLITVYHPSDKKLQTHANVGWVGFVGVLTGISSKVSIGEKVWLPKDNSVKMTRYGNPWTFALRDVLYEAVDIESALQILTKTHRTCAIHLGLASSEDHEFRMLQYSEKILNNYDDYNYTHYTAAHPKKTGIAYFDKHVQPSGDSCVGQLLTDPNYYGKWDMQTFWRVVGNTHNTGDTQLVVFNLEKQLAMISYSRNYNDQKGDHNEEAFRRSPILVDMGKLWWEF